MFMLNIIVVIAGVIFFAFGFLVCFKKKYNLVVGAHKSANKEAYAEQIGIIALMSGMLYIFAGIVGFVMMSYAVSFLMLSMCIALTVSLTIISTLKASKA